MPATPTLLKKLKETLGEEATSDLVTWVDHSVARDIAQLRELADLHYGRFDARLEQRLAELRAELQPEMGAIRQDLVRLEARFEARLDVGLGALRIDMASQRADLMKWMFIYWAGTIVSLAGSVVALVNFLS